MLDGYNRTSFRARRCAWPGADAVEALSHRSFARHTHDTYGIGRIVQGAQRSWSGRGQVEAAQGAIITVNPGEVHDGAPIGEIRAWKMLYFEPETISTLVADIRDGVTGNFEFVDPVVQDCIRGDAFERAYQALAGPRADALLGEEKLILLLAGLVGTKPRCRPPDSPGLVQARSRIDDDPACPHTLADLARLAGLSRFQLVRGFATLTGLTPHSYVVQRRIDAARKLIRTGAKLADVAAACGFADQSHLTRAFVRRFGLTPGAFAGAVR